MGRTLSRRLRRFFLHCLGAAGLLLVVGITVLAFSSLRFEIRMSLFELAAYHPSNPFSRPSSHSWNTLLYLKVSHPVPRRKFIPKNTPQIYTEDFFAPRYVAWYSDRFHTSYHLLGLIKGPEGSEFQTRVAHRLEIPFWCLAAPPFLLSLGAYFLIRRPRRHSGSDPFCRNCGYDLRATPSQCPECGTQAAAGRAS